MLFIYLIFISLKYCLYIFIIINNNFINFIKINKISKINKIKYIFKYKFI